MCVITDTCVSRYTYTLHCLIMRRCSCSFDPFLLAAWQVAACVQSNRKIDCGLKNMASTQEVILSLCNKLFFCGREVFVSQQWPLEILMSNYISLIFITRTQMKRKSCWERVKVVISRQWRDCQVKSLYEMFVIMIGLKMAVYTKLLGILISLFRAGAVSIYHCKWIESWSCDCWWYNHCSLLLL